MAVIRPWPDGNNLMPEPVDNLFDPLNPINSHAIPFIPMTVICKSG